MLHDSLGRLGTVGSHADRTVSWFELSMLPHLVVPPRLELPREVGALHVKKLRRILSFERSRNQRRGAEFFLGKVDFMRWFPVAFLTNGVLL